MLTKRLTFALVVCFAVAAACDTRGLSYGDPNSIIAVMSPTLWEQTSETVYAELEQTVWGELVDGRRQMYAALLELEAGATA